MQHHATLQTLWLKHAAGIGASEPSIAALSRLIAAWNEPNRHYHTLRHLQECLQLLERWPTDPETQCEVGMALWFHDAVYDPTRADNEERSAGWARRELQAMDVEPDRIERIAKLILATRHSSHDASDQEAVRGVDLMLDIDLAILGSDRGRFEEYERQVRLEYAHVADDQFSSARAAFLEDLLAKPIYRTPTASEQLEARARDNLTRALRFWRSQARDWT